MITSRSGAVQRLWLCVWLAVCGAGCSRSETAAEKTYPDYSAVVQSAALTDPLTHEEIAAFVAIMRELPPTGDSHLVGPEMFVQPNLGGVEQFRKHLRQRLEAEFLSQRWLSEPRTVNVLRKFRVDPPAFATLTLRVSTAWSARQMSSQVSLPVVQRSVEIELSRMIRDLQSNSQLLSQMDREQLQDAIHNCVALSEFVWLLQQVPSGSVLTAQAFDEPLRDVLPRQANSTTFERRFESKAEILKTGWSTAQ